MGDQGSTSSTGVTGEKIWLDGRFVDWSDGNVHLLTHTLHYGLGVFEGIRCYRTADDRSAVFQLGPHIRRLFDSARINLLEIPFDPQTLSEVVVETLRPHPGHGAERNLFPQARHSVGLVHFHW